MAYAIIPSFLYGFQVSRLMSSGLHSTPTSFSPSFIVSGCFLSDLRSPWGGVESQWSWDLHFSVGEVEQFFFFFLVCLLALCTSSSENYPSSSHLWIGLVSFCLFLSSLYSIPINSLLDVQLFSPVLRASSYSVVSCAVQKLLNPVRSPLLVVGLTPRQRESHSESPCLCLILFFLI